MCAMLTLDVAFSVFYGMPPRLFVQELRVPFPCSLDAYMAMSASECSQYLMEESGPVLSYDMSHVILAFTNNNAELYANIENLSPLTLFFVIFGRIATPNVAEPAFY